MILRISSLMIFMLLFLACKEKKRTPPSNSKSLNSINTLLPEPKPGDWLYNKKEKGQSFRKYIDSKHVCPNEVKNKIYLQPIGVFDNIDYSTLNHLRAYVEIFFGLKTILLETMSDSVVPAQSRRINNDIEQLHSKYVMDSILIKSFPEDGLAYLAISSYDLYPKDDWNFVFGQANLKKGVGISSIYRFKDEDVGTVNYNTFLNRIMRTATHEITHMLSIKHCIKYRCLMNGSMNLSEVNNKPSWLCPDCLVKLLWCTQSDIDKRYDSLISFSSKHKYPLKEKFYQKSKNIIKTQSKMRMTKR